MARFIYEIVPWTQALFQQHDNYLSPSEGLVKVIFTFMSLASRQHIWLRQSLNNEFSLIFFFQQMKTEKSLIFN